MRPRRKLLLPILLTLFEHLAFSCHGSLLITILEELRRKIKQVFCICRSREIDTINIVSRSIHFALQHLGDSYLVLQDGLAHLSLAHRMTTLSCAAFQHQQSIFFRLLQHQLSRLLEILLIIQIEAESPAWQLHTLHYPLRIMSGIIKLYQSSLRPIISFASQSQICLLLVASTNQFIFLLRGDGAGNLVPVLHPYQITAHLCVSTYYY
jgi:hypothetical protein